LPLRDLDVQATSVGIDVAVARRSERQQILILDFDLD